MLVEVVINEEHQSIVSADLSRRRADILGMCDRHVSRVRTFFETNFCHFIGSCHIKIFMPVYVL